MKTSFTACTHHKHVDAESSCNNTSQYSCLRSLNDLAYIILP